jgi:hypothetical protein
MWDISPPAIFPFRYKERDMPASGSSAPRTVIEPTQLWLAAQTRDKDVDARCSASQLRIPVIPASRLSYGQQSQIIGLE